MCDDILQNALRAEWYLLELEEGLRLLRYAAASPFIDSQLSKQKETSFCLVISNGLQEWQGSNGRVLKELYG
jgi:hypothetical protein